MSGIYDVFVIFFDRKKRMIFTDGSYSPATHRLFFANDCDNLICIHILIYSPTNIERFSFECRKVISFAFATLQDWLKKFAPIFYPIRSKTKTNRDSLARVFPRFASATCNYFEF